MADEKKVSTDAEVTAKAAKADAKKVKEKKPSKFAPKNIWAAIKRFFKDLRGETKKIVWPNRQMVLKSTGVVLASILVIGIGIWVIDFALSGAVTAVNKAAAKVEETTTEPVTEKTEAEVETTVADKAEEEAVSDTADATEPETTESVSKAE